VVLIGYPDPRMPGSDEVCAVVVLAGEPPALADLTSHLEREQVTMENWPDRAEIFAALPKNSLGKILRTQLRQEIEGRPAQP
jgi:cyclohexanecarboxylate-CoA ligase